MRNERTEKSKTISAVLPEAGESANQLRQRNAATNQKGQSGVSENPLPRVSEGGSANRAADYVGFGTQDWLKKYEGQFVFDTNSPKASSGDFDRVAFRKFLDQSPLLQNFAARHGGKLDLTKSPYPVVDFQTLKCMVAVLMINNEFVLGSQRENSLAALEEIFSCNSYEELKAIKGALLPFPNLVSMKAPDGKEFFLVGETYLPLQIVSRHLQDEENGGPNGWLLPAQKKAVLELVRKEFSKVINGAGLEMKESGDASALVMGFSDLLTLTKNDAMRTNWGWFWKVKEGIEDFVVPGGEGAEDNIGGVFQRNRRQEDEDKPSPVEEDGR